MWEFMRIIALKSLKNYWQKVPQTELELKAWFAEAKAADWGTPAAVKAKYGNASILKDGRVVFNICGNNHRLVTWINYEFRTIYVRFLGTHKEYDRIDAQTI
jgi:mRNA interferase HigB